MQASDFPPEAERRRTRRRLLIGAAQVLGALAIGGLAGSGTACSRLPLPAASITILLTVTDYQLVFADVRVDDRPARALLDTGGSTGVQLSSTLVRELALNVQEANGQRQRLDGSARRRQSGMLPSFALGDYRQGNSPFEMIDGDIEKIAQQVGTSFDVILGWAFFSQFQSVFDEPAARLELRPLGSALTEPSPPAPSATTTLTLPYSDAGGVPIVEGHIGEATVRLVVDTGAPFSTLDAGLVSTLPSGVGRQEVPYRGQRVTLDVRDVAFGEQQHALAFLPKDLAALRPIGAHGVLGNDLLSQHQVTFDPPTSTIRLAKGQGTRKGHAPVTSPLSPVP